MTPQISVIIPNLHSPIIDQTLDALHQQTVDLSQVEVLVVGLDGPGLVQEDDLVRLVSSGAPASPAANRNHGIREAQGEILCFTDADCVPRPDWLARLIAPYDDAAVSVVGGGVIFASDNYWTTCDNLSWFHEFLASAPMGAREHLASLNLSLRREVIETVGPFDERYPHAAGEDADWTVRMRRAGYQLYFVPGAVVEHRPRRSDLRAVWRHAYNFGRYSTRINPAHSDWRESSYFLRHWPLLLLCSPLLAAGATARIFLADRATWRWWPTWPGIWLSKLAWCLGATRTLAQPGIPLEHTL
jgi:GT2 family glycosyltransferase